MKTPKVDHTQAPLSQGILPGVASATAASTSSSAGLLTSSPSLGGFSTGLPSAAAGSLDSAASLDFEDKLVEDDDDDDEDFGVPAEDEAEDEDDGAEGDASETAAFSASSKKLRWRKNTHQREQYQLPLIMTAYCLERLVVYNQLHKNRVLDIWVFQG